MTRRIEYKFWYIKRDDDGIITEAAIRFYEGDYIQRQYKRLKRLQKADLSRIGNKFVKELSGSDARLYTPKDFGIISTDDELREFLNKELVKDKDREPVEEQKWLP